MRRRIAIAIIIIVCFLLQCTVFKSLSIGNVSPNLLLVVTAAFGFMRGNKEGLWVGFFCGLLMDLMFSDVLGFYALVFMFVGFVNGFFRKSFYPDEIRLPLILIAVSDFACNVVVYIGLFVFRGKLDMGYYIIHTMIPELIYTMLVAILLYYILLKVNQKLEETEKRSETKFV
ncbi:MAG: rod shape-determining protein MreD [Clostridiales bacterium]|nr:rod shape-determining protein MreD [Clostridiales bacterium]